MVKGNQLRLFFAVELAPAIKSKLLAVQDRIPDIVARPVPGDNFHITLSFLGNVTEKALENILDNFEPPVIAPFDVEITDLVYWAKPKILAAAIQDERHQLNQCKKQTEKSLAQIDHFHFDKKPYKPHVTLFRKVEQPPKDNIEIGMPFRVAQISLMESSQGRNGVVYDAIESWSLRPSSIKQQLLGR